MFAQLNVLVLGTVKEWPYSSSCPLVSHRDKACKLHHLECKSVISSARRKPTAKSRVVAQVYTPEEHSVEDTWKKGRQGTVPNTGQRAALLKKEKGDLAHYTNIHLYCYNFITLIMCFWFNGLRLWLKHIWSDYLPSSFPLLFYLLIIMFFPLPSWYLQIYEAQSFDSFMALWHFVFRLRPCSVCIVIFSYTQLFF